MDCSQSTQVSRQNYTTHLNLEPRGEEAGKEDDRETRGATIWKQTSKKLDTVEEIDSRLECLVE